MISFIFRLFRLFIWKNDRVIWAFYIRIWSTISMRAQTCGIRRTTGRAELEKFWFCCWLLLLILVVCVLFYFFFYFHSIAFYNGDEMLKLCGSAKNYIHQVGELTIKYVTHAMCGRTQKPMSKTSTRSARVQCVCVCESKRVRE